MEQYIKERENRLKKKYVDFIGKKCQNGGVISGFENKKWKAFFISDICEIESGRDIYDAERIEGDVPYITSTSTNNGIKYYVSNTNETLEENAISVNRNGSVGYSFYHKYKALYSNDCRKLKLKQCCNEFIALFITNQITQQKDKYNYGYKMGTGRLKRQRIMLPITDDGQPDYAFMEQYIREREDKLKQKYIDFIGNNYQIGGVLPSLENKAWAVFNLKDLFDIIQRGKRLIREHQQVGKMPYVSSTAMNNGIDGFISTERTTREFSNCLTIANSGSVGSSFYQPSKFIASDHITHLKNDSYTMYVYLFIATMTKRMSEKYNFNREINDYRISKEKILLPTTDEDSPDYEYMEQYIKAVMFGKYKKYLEYIKNR